MQIRLALNADLPVKEPANASVVFRRVTLRRLDGFQFADERTVEDVFKLFEKPCDRRAVEQAVVVDKGDPHVAFGVDWSVTNHHVSQ